MSEPVTNVNPEDSDISSGVPPETMAAIAAAMEAMREPEEAQSGAEPAGEEGGEEAPAEGEKDVTEAAPAEPPSPQDGKFADAWARLEAQAKEVEAERRRLRDLDQRAKNLDSASAEYQADRIAAVKRLISGYLGTEDDKAISAELQSLYEDWTGQILGVQSGKSKPAAESSLRREMTELRRQYEAEKAQREKERLEAEKSRHLETATSQCTSYVTEHQADLPYLSAGAQALGEQPGAVLMRWVEEAQAKGQSNLTLEQVATNANNWFAQLADKFRPLLSEQGTTPPAKLPATAKPAVPRRTLPSTRATERPAAQSRPYNPDHSEARSEAWKLLQQTVRKGD